MSKRLFTYEELATTLSRSPETVRQLARRSMVWGSNDTDPDEEKLRVSSWTRFKSLPGS